MRAIVLGMALLAAAPAMAQKADPVCQAQIVPGFEAWNGAGGGALTAGAKAMLTLTPAASVGFVPPPVRTPAAGTFGGVFPIDIAKAGTYRIALGGKAWIEVVRDGRRLTSTAHAMGADCSGIRKIVAFALTPGRYLVQISEATSPSIAAMVTAAP